MHTTFIYLQYFFHNYITTNQITILDDAKQVKQILQLINQVYPESMSSFNKYNTIILLNTNLRLGVANCPLLYSTINDRKT